MKIWAILAAIILSVCATSGAAEEPRGPLAPRNDCAKLPDFHAFDTALRDALARKDADALLKLAADDVHLDFGGGSGKAEWRKRLNGDYNNWLDLKEAISLGCDGSVSEEEGETHVGAAFPWFWSNNQGEVDPYAAQLVTGNNVLLRSGPSPSAEPIGRVSWDWVEGDYESAENGYRKVKTSAGMTGYMSDQYLRPLIGYRLIAAKTDEGWRITAFIAGD